MTTVIAGSIAIMIEIEGGHIGRPLSIDRSASNYFIAS
jgi:hypothetical protein